MPSAGYLDGDHNPTDMSKTATETEESISDNSDEQIATPNGFSREPADYAPTEHFLTRFSSVHGSSASTRICPEITGDVVETCIREGELLEGEGRCWRLEAEVGGYQWRLVVDIRPDEDNRVCTALVPGVHRPSHHDPERRLGGGER